jgi:putative glutamine amidotransferase
VSRRAVIGITLRPQAIDGYRRRYAQNRSYVDRIVAAGAVPLCIPPLLDEEALLTLFGHCDALILPGGPDVEPRRYGEEPDPRCNVRSEPELDAADLLLCGRARDAAVPILAICRGAQLLNVACGGTLWQDVRVQGATEVGHDVDVEGEPVHGVRCEPGSRLATIVGEAPGRVNSVHHQGIRRLGSGLRAVAWSDDGLIEGIEGVGAHGDGDHGFVVGVQWHPEDLAADHPAGQPLVDALVQAAVAAVPAR